MRSIYLLFSFAFLFNYSPLSATVCDSIGSITQNGKKFIQYKVEKGTTLYSLSKLYNVSVDEIMQVNSIQSLTLGQIILIPDKKNNLVKEKSNSHTVVLGETLYSISKSENVSVEDLKKLNHLADNSISVGQVLILRKSGTRIKEEFNSIHVVAKGETLYSIATKYNLSVEAIKKENGFTSNDLTLGQKILLPKEITNSSKIVFQKGVKLLNSKSDLLDQSLCEVLSPIGNEGEILKIRASSGKTVYARIVGKSQDNQLYSTNNVFKILDINTFSTTVDIEFCVTK